MYFRRLVVINSLSFWDGCVHAKSLQSSLTLCNPMDCSLPGSSVQGILQSRILKWVAYKSLKASCQFYNPETVIRKDLGSISLKYKHQRRQYVCLPVSWLQWGPFSKLWLCSLSWCCKTVSFSRGWRQLANRDDLPPLLPTPILKNSTACVSAKLSSDWILASVS